MERHPVICYFAMAFAISWIGAALVVTPKLARSQSLDKASGLLMFPVMLLGPSLAGLMLTTTLEGRPGLHQLWARMTRWRVGRWYAALLIPAAAIYSVLMLMRVLVSPVFSPNLFLPGALFGILAGFLEEIGWMGFAFRKMRQPHDALKPAIILGALWGVWHFPVIDYLGAASPHGHYLWLFFLAFIAAMTAMRALIAWIYCNTESLGLAQVMHMSSTGSLVVLSPPAVSAAQEALWYGVYASALWLLLAAIVWRSGGSLMRNGKFRIG